MDPVDRVNTHYGKRLRSGDRPQPQDKKPGAITNWPPVTTGRDAIIVFRNPGSSRRFSHESTNRRRHRAYQHRGNSAAAGPRGRRHVVGGCIGVGPRYRYAEAMVATKQMAIYGLKAAFAPLKKGAKSRAVESFEPVKFIRRPFGGNASKPSERSFNSCTVKCSNEMLWSDPYDS